MLGHEDRLCMFAPSFACITQNPLHFFSKTIRISSFLNIQGHGKIKLIHYHFSHYTSIVGPKHGQVKSLHVPQGGLHEDNYSIMWFELYDNWIWANEGQSFVGRGAALKLNSVHFHSGFSMNERTGEIIYES